ncbi:hypothetical protein LFML04_1692 [Leptospirillum ferriphilum ML-04]|uniref:Uncharacterized protein n=1 Tax=Leptospirillum ferriphilum (strain ML-04) TaxID=1048260 RepID=J9ZBT6_LEPFM|nr:hypothetical protein LFML04_1692 [Leptospirillum ferriphilum ML-04]
MIDGGHFFLLKSESLSLSGVHCNKKSNFEDGIFQEWL